MVFMDIAVYLIVLIAFRFNESEKVLRTDMCHFGTLKPSICRLLSHFLSSVALFVIICSVLDT